MKKTFLVLLICLSNSGWALADEPAKGAIISMDDGYVVPRIPLAQRPTIWRNSCAKRIASCCSANDKHQLENKTVSCSFRIAKTGAISELEILESSGSKQTDEAALRALRDAAPLSVPADIFLSRKIGVKFENSKPDLFFPVKKVEQTSQNN